MQFKDIVPSLLLTAQAHAATIQPRADSLNVRAITLNIRYAADESDRYKDEKPWDERKEYVADLLKTLAGDATDAGAVPVIGLQEAEHDQLADIKKDLGDDWDHVGTGRDDGKEKGEYSPILYRKSVVKLVNSTQLWVSKTPEKPSKWPGTNSPRYAIAAVFDHAGTGGRFIAANTHLDSRSSEARSAGVKTALDCIRYMQVGNGYPVPAALTGDFNSEPGDENDAYSTVIEDGYLKDAYNETSGNNRVGPWDTYAGFDSDEEEMRLDFIFLGHAHNASFIPTHYEVVEDNVKDGVIFSDHRAVYADLEIKKDE